MATRGTVPFRLKPLHRFIGEAISSRTEVLAVLHLLDKPDAAWEDPAMDLIYDDLRDEFDLVDRYAALTSKLQSIQDSLVLVLDVARDRRLVLLEVIVVLLILLEVILTFTQKEAADRGIVVDDNSAFAVDDLPSGGEDGNLADAVVFGLRGVILAVGDLEPPEAVAEHEEQH